MENHCLPENPGNSPYTVTVGESLGIKESTVRAKEADSGLGWPPLGILPS